MLTPLDILLITLTDFLFGLETFILEMFSSLLESLPRPSL